jgi:hypothetical protein
MQIQGAQARDVNLVAHPQERSWGNLLHHYNSTTQLPAVRLHRFVQDIRIQRDGAPSDVLIERRSDGHGREEIWVLAQDEPSCGVSVFLPFESTTEALHTQIKQQHLQRTQCAVCKLTVAGADLPDGLGIMQDRAFAIPLGQRSSVHCTGAHFSLYPTKDMLLTDFQRLITSVTTAQACNLTVPSAMSNGKSAGNCSPIYIDDKQWPTDMMVCWALALCDVTRHSTSDTNEHMIAAYYCRVLTAVDWSRDVLCNNSSFSSRAVARAAEQYSHHCDKTATIKEAELLDALKELLADNIPDYTPNYTFEVRAKLIYSVLH